MSVIGGCDEYDINIVFCKYFIGTVYNHGIGIAKSCFAVFSNGSGGVIQRFNMQAGIFRCQRQVLFLCDGTAADECRIQRRSHNNYPLTAPLETPLMMYFWKTVKIKTGGMIPMMEAAAMMCQRMVVSVSRL